MSARTTPGSNVGRRVDGVDVAQLLGDIGEASANESAVELFRLCLGAQRVLAAVIGDRVTSMSAFDWRTLRAVGQGVCMGCVVAGIAGTIVLRFGDAGLLSLAVFAGPGLILLSHFMERRAKQTQKDSDEQI